MRTIPKKFSVYYLKFLSFILSFLISIIIGPFIYCLSFYAHEAGHIIFGFLDNLITEGILAKFQIVEWVKCNCLITFQLPQRNKIIYGKPSVSYAIGGIIFTILVSTLFSFYYFKKSKNKNKKFIFMVPALLIINEFLGNFICGTDNFLHNPYSICQKYIILNYAVRLIPVLLIIPAFLLFYPYVKNKITHFINDLLNK